jgi:predicted O-methyltransferase YrrM
MSEIQRATMQRLYGTDIWQGYKERHAEESVQGWHGTHPSLKRLVATAGAKIVVDVGVWKGQSTITMARSMQQAGIDGVVIGIDTFLGSPEHWEGAFSQFTREHGMPTYYWTFLSNVARAGLTDYVVPMPQTSTTAVQILQRKKIKASVVHVDAAHEYREVLRDAEDYWELLEDGGYLIGDDYSPNWPGVVQASHEFAAKVGREMSVEGPKWILRK